MSTLVIQLPKSEAIFFCLLTHITKLSPTMETIITEQKNAECTPIARQKSPVFTWLIVLFVLCYYAFQHRDDVVRLVNGIRAQVEAAIGVTSGNARSKQEDSDATKQTSRTVAKLDLLNAKLYGTKSCGWTVRQLEVFGDQQQKVQAAMYIDCTETPGRCLKVSHFPTWEIGGEVMPPGMVSLDVLGAQCDAVLMASYKLPAIDDPNLQTPPPPTPPLSDGDTEEEEEVQEVEVDSSKEGIPVESSKEVSVIDITGDSTPEPVVEVVEDVSTEGVVPQKPKETNAKPKRRRTRT
jgi:hypothetical protein